MIIDNSNKIIESPIELKNLNNGNQFIGELPILEKSNIKFKGKNNILVCEKNVKLVNSYIDFNGDNSIVYLCESKFDYKVGISTNNNSAFYMGKNNYINKNITFVISERKHIFIGNDGIFSLGIWMRNADPHLIYDCDSKKRINPTKSIFLGDHIWIGQEAIILKGTKIHSGSIIGAKSVITNKEIPSNESWAGNPIRKIKDNLFWEGSCVNIWTEEKTKEREIYDSDEYIFEFKNEEYIDFDIMDRNLSEAKTSTEMYNYLKNINNKKDRFSKK